MREPIPVPDVPAPTVTLCWQHPPEQTGGLHQHCRFPVGHEGLHEWELRRIVEAARHLAGIYPVAGQKAFDEAIEALSDLFTFKAEGDPR